MTLVTNGDTGDTRALRDRGHDVILPRVKTERFKREFVNKCPFSFISRYLFCSPNFVIL